ncbi:MAG: methylated-DNA--[protein]-cysteine S-methyltransferase [Candidatus Omnitrophica bacterium]|nr:methylated-DNA--[protein]-cysteine S-methyltransferase [Candidatus Omnitrophota bacterium]
MVYTITNSPLGYLLLAATKKGLCTARLGDDKKQLEREFNKEFGASKSARNDHYLKKRTQALIDYLEGRKPWPLLPYDVQATVFQKRVWEWLRTIPSGKTYHYSEAAKAIGRPSAIRAVARACATNPVALVIPCHRIVPKAGGVGGYRWDPARKQKLLKLENR